MQKTNPMTTPRTHRFFRMSPLFELSIATGCRLRRRPGDLATGAGGIYFAHALRAAVRSGAGLRIPPVSAAPGMAPPRARCRPDTPGTDGRAAGCPLREGGSRSSSGRIPNRPALPGGWTRPSESVEDPAPAPTTAEAPQSEGSARLESDDSPRHLANLRL